MPNEESERWKPLFIDKREPEPHPEQRPLYEDQIDAWYAVYANRSG